MQDAVEVLRNLRTCLVLRYSIPFSIHGVDSCASWDGSDLPGIELQVLGLL